MHIYTRDESGLITYKGDNGLTLDEMREGAMALGLPPAHEWEAPEIETLKGWPTSQVTWFGHFGVSQ